MLTGKINIQQIKVEINKLPDDVKKAKFDSLEELGQGLLENIKYRAPKNLGNYSRGWKIVSKSENKVSMGSDNRPLYTILEFQGSKPHDIRSTKPHNLLVWEDERGNTVFRNTKFKPVKHPGFPPIPHVRPSMKDVLGESTKIILKHFGRKNKILKKGSQKYQSTKINVRRTVVGKTGKKRLSRRRTQKVKIS